MGHGCSHRGVKVTIDGVEYAGVSAVRYDVGSEDTGVVSICQAHGRTVGEVLSRDSVFLELDLESEVD